MLNFAVDGDLHRNAIVEQQSGACSVPLLRLIDHNEDWQSG